MQLRQTTEIKVRFSDPYRLLLPRLYLDFSIVTQKNVHIKSNFARIWIPVFQTIPGKLDRLKFFRCNHWKPLPNPQFQNCDQFESSLLFSFLNSDSLTQKDYNRLKGHTQTQIGKQSHCTNYVKL